MRKFPRIRQLFFFIGENKTKKIHAKSVERSVIHLCFVSRIPIFNKKRTRNERL